MIFWICFVLAFIPLIIILPTKIIGKKKLKLLKAKNRENITNYDPERDPFGKKTSGAVLCINHYSNFDAPIVSFKLQRKIRVLAKAELFENKFSGWFIKQLGGIKITRGTADPAAIKESLKVLKRGKLLGIFPEGTRNKTEDDDVQNVHNGAVVIAARAGVPIIPMIIYKRPKLFRRNIIIVGDPFYIESEIERKPNKEETDRATQELVEKMKLLRDTLDEKYKNKHKKTA